MLEPSGDNAVYRQALVLNGCGEFKRYFLGNVFFGNIFRYLLAFDRSNDSKGEFTIAVWKN
jgi:hypothetical protein